jgi:hypothetical protein
LPQLPQLAASVSVFTQALADSQKVCPVVAHPQLPALHD